MADYGASQPNFFSENLSDHFLSNYYFWGKMSSQDQEKLGLEKKMLTSAILKPKYVSGDSEQLWFFLTPDCFAVCLIVDLDNVQYPQ